MKTFWACFAFILLSTTSLLSVAQTTGSCASSFESSADTCDESALSSCVADLEAAKQEDGSLSSDALASNLAGAAIAMPDSTTASSSEIVSSASTEVEKCDANNLMLNSITVPESCSGTSAAASLETFKAENAKNCQELEEAEEAFAAEAAAVAAAVENVSEEGKCADATNPGSEEIVGEGDIVELWKARSDSYCGQSVLIPKPGLLNEGDSVTLVKTANPEFRIISQAVTGGEGNIMVRFPINTADLQESITITMPNGAEFVIEKPSARFRHRGAQ